MMAPAVIILRIRGCRRHIVNFCEINKCGNNNKSSCGIIIVAGGLFNFPQHTALHYNYCRIPTSIARLSSTPPPPPHLLLVMITQSLAGLNGYFLLVLQNGTKRRKLVAEMRKNSCRQYEPMRL